MRKKVILIDSDVISHFIAANKIDDLTKILSPHTLFIVPQVYEESIRHPFYEDREEEVDEWIARCNIMKMDFPSNDLRVKLEYYRLKKEDKRIGKGERACMAIAKYGKEVIASSNFRDVAEYCDANDIEYIGLMDILCIAIKKGIYDIETCNKFIHVITIVNGARLPFDDITKYTPTRDLGEF